MQSVHLSLQAQEVGLGLLESHRVFFAGSMCPPYILGVVFVWSLWSLKQTREEPR